MVNGINQNSMQQMQYMNQIQNRRGQGMGKGHGMGQLMQALPQDFREQLRNTLQSMDETQRKDIVSQLKELDVANMSQDELIAQIQNILNPTSTASNYSVYA